MTTIGLISDTHGLLRPNALDALCDCEHIIHAGDIGGTEILNELLNIAPITVVRGNMDKNFNSRQLNITEIFDINNYRILAIHNLLDLGLPDLDINPKVANISVIVSGHTHEPEIKRTNGILYVNPGSAGPKRPNKPITLGRLMISEDEIKAEIINLE